MEGRKETNGGEGFDGIFAHGPIDLSGKTKGRNDDLVRLDLVSIPCKPLSEQPFPRLF